MNTFPWPGKLNSKHPLGPTKVTVLSKEEHESGEGWWYNVRLEESRGFAYPVGYVVMAEPYEVERL
jgi:hypothetical protein